MEKYNKPFMSIKEACAATGLSTCFLRNGVKTGTVPAIRSGAKYLINVPLLMKRLNTESEAGGDRDDTSGRFKN